MDLNTGPYIPEAAVPCVKNNGKYIHFPNTYGIIATDVVCFYAFLNFIHTSHLLINHYCHPAVPSGP